MVNDPMLSDPTQPLSQATPPPASLNEAPTPQDRPEPTLAPYQAAGPTPRWRRARFRALLVGVILLAGLAGGAFAVYNECCASPTARAVVASYYDALQRQDYSTAYSYLDPRITLIIDGQSQPISATRFTQAAQAYDRQRGTVSTFDITSVRITGSGGSGGSADITVRVTRGASAPYDVHLHVRQEGSDWIIIGFDNL
jgi:hypothetical protein